MLSTRGGFVIMVSSPTAPIILNASAYTRGCPGYSPVLLNRQGVNMRIRRFFRRVSAVGAALLKALITSVVLGVVVVSIMHYMGVPVPSAHDLLRGLTHIFS